MIIEADLDVDTQETAPSYRLLALQSIIDNAVTIEVHHFTNLSFLTISTKYTDYFSSSHLSFVSCTLHHHRLLL